VEEARRGDHICYISDLRSFRGDYPGWELSVSLDQIFDELAAAASDRYEVASA
jgi:CDP-paratose 2-epimerase